MEKKTPTWVESFFDSDNYDTNLKQLINKLENLEVLISLNDIHIIIEEDKPKFLDMI